MDNLTKDQRKKNMSNIRSSGTKPERIVAKELRQRKIYFAAHVKKILGKPDFVFRKKRVAVFIDSDFWHGHPVRCIQPKSNTSYWSQKIQRNRQRDEYVTDSLTKDGWNVIRIWEYDLKHQLCNEIKKILHALGR